MAGYNADGVRKGSLRGGAVPGGLVLAEDAALRVLVMQLGAEDRLPARGAEVELGRREHARAAGRRSRSRGRSSRRPRTPEPKVRAGFMLIPESGASKVMKVATSTPAQRPVYARPAR